MLVIMLVRKANYGKSKNRKALVRRVIYKQNRLGGLFIWSMKRTRTRLGRMMRNKMCLRLQKIMDKKN